MKRSEVLALNDTQFNKAVKIQGTNYDRKRKVTSDLLRKINKMLSHGRTPEQVAAHYGLSKETVLYNTNPEYRAKKLASMTGKHTGKTTITVEDRTAYKRGLVKAGKKVMYTTGA